MLRGKQHDLLHLLAMLEAMEKILIFSEPAADAESFYQLNDQLNFNAVLNLLAHVGETSGKLSSDFSQNVPEIEWKKIRGLRNRIVHDYLGLDTLMLFQVIRDDVPKLLNTLYHHTQNRIKNKTFDMEELNAAIESVYYNKLNFSRLQ